MYSFITLFIKVFEKCWIYWLGFNFWICSLVCVLVGITSSAVGLKICEITVGNEKYKSIIKNKKKKYEEIALLGKAKLNNIEILKSLIDSYISHDEFT